MLLSSLDFEEAYALRLSFDCIYVVPVGGDFLDWFYRVRVYFPSVNLIPYFS